MNYDQLRKEHPECSYYRIKNEIDIRRTHDCTRDWFLNLTDNSWCVSLNLLQNHIVIQTVVQKDYNYKTIETYINVDLY